MKKNEVLPKFSDSVRFSGKIEGGFCWDALCKERMKNPKALEYYGYKVYSQNDEDGIIHEIFKRIGTTDKRFIEFGVQDGLESNTHLLLFYGWKGVWIEGSSEYCNQIMTKFQPVIKSERLKIKNAFITKENINSLFYEIGFTGEIDLLSIDIDGNDLYVWDAINVISPRVVIVEYNGKFPPDLEWTQAYDSAHVWGGSDWHGASLKAFENLGRKKGYRLVGTNLRGCNAFFVRNDLAKDLFYEEATAEALYNPLRIDLVFSSAHPAKYCLLEQKENFGMFNYQNYEILEEFSPLIDNGGGGIIWREVHGAKIKILVAKGTKYLRIPYFLTRKTIYKVIFESSLIGKKKFLIKKKSGEFKFVFSGIQDDAVVIVKITIAEAWSPKTLLKTILRGSYSKTVGIDLQLSGMKQIL